ncbi:MAG: hypothetical protein JXR64_02385 [Spirochaetales bacterium]|nr:hypothetical protein [Spirochaetales bacterium]
MKYILLFLPLVISCDAYNFNKEYKICGIVPGKIVISSNNYYKEFETDNYSNLILDLPKGEIYTISLYSYFFNELTRYPKGIVTNDIDYTYTFSLHLGCITSAINHLHSLDGSIEQDKIEDLKEMFNSCDDPWQYNYSEIYFYLTEDVSISNISLKKSFSIPSLEFLYSFEPENSLFYYWYPSIQNFYDLSSNKKIRLEIKDDGEFLIF